MIVLEWPGRASFMIRANKEDNLRDWVRHDGSPKILRAIEIEAPKRTGRLANSFSVSVDNTPNGAEGKISSSLYYAKYVARGTRPHLIHAHGAHALHWQDQVGRDAFAKFVHHPGSRPNDFIGRAVDRIILDLHESFHAAVTKGF